MNPPSNEAELRARAKRAGVAPEYTDAHGKRQTVGGETLEAILELLDTKPPERGIEPVLIAWDGQLSLPARKRWPSGLTLGSESGADLGPLEDLPGAAPLPFGVHRVFDGEVQVAVVIAAPSRVGAGNGGARPWGLFAPAYAIWDERGRPAGDITALERLALAGRGRGATSLATLPLLAELATLDGGWPGQQPYSPLSRMFWNEAYLDLARIPELAGELPPALDAAALACGLRGSRRGGGGVVDLAGLASSARPLLDEALRRVDHRGGDRRAAFQRYVTEHPELARYARYRAAAEVAGGQREQWPPGWQEGAFDDVPGEAARRHCFAQWAMDGQLEICAQELGNAGTGLIMDLPIGCAASGYDPWAFPDVYLSGASIGAPPDIFFGAGQDWGFPPPHPEIDRRQGYPVLRACLAHSLQHASVLRIDHILGWSRLWWIPAGMAAHEGAYVRYRFEELLAVANLEARRHGATLVGEDLGTVERTIRSKLRAHELSGMTVAVFDLSDHPGRALRPSVGAYAYVDTHDTATFAGWFNGSDIALRQALGLIEASDAASERAARTAARAKLMRRVARRRRRGAAGPDPAGGGGGGDASEREAFVAVLEELGGSEAACVVVAVEDLWSELDPQNVPGTMGHDNFARRFAFPSERLRDDDTVAAPLARLDLARRG